MLQQLSPVIASRSTAAKPKVETPGHSRTASQAGQKAKGRAAGTQAEAARHLHFWLQHQALEVRGSKGDGDGWNAISCRQRRQRQQ